MSVGGKIIEIRPVKISNLLGDFDVVRIWVMDPRTGDEACVYAKVEAIMPLLGESVWWGAGLVHFRGDSRHLRKIAYSFSPPMNECDAPAP